MSIPSGQRLADHSDPRFSEDNPVGNPYGGKSFWESPPPEEGQEWSYTGMKFILVRKIDEDMWEVKMTYPIHSEHRMCHLWGGCFFLEHPDVLWPDENWWEGEEEL